MRGYLKEQFVGVTGLLAELDSSPSSGHSGIENLTQRADLGALTDTALALAVTSSLPENVHPEFATLIDQLASAWPSLVPLFKLSALRLCEELPVSQSKHYGPLLIRLRAE